MRPLYQKAASGVQWQGGHAGLWYDKFCDVWKPDFSGLSDEGKKEWVKSVTTRRVGNTDQLTQHQKRLSKLLAAHGQTLLPYKLESSFVTGLGRAHPVENGFAWHHTLGTPYLPGSSVKGMVRAWAEQWEGADKATVQRLFGSEDDKDKQFQVGSVIFLDALPKEPVQLKADVMTPHYGPYYQDSSGKTPPADWHSPIPVPFLVVEKGATFLFGVLPRRDDDQSKEDCETVKGWLEEALEWTGAGAKTAVGYGRFGMDKASMEALEKERHQQRARQEATAAARRQQEELARQTAGKSELYAMLFKEASDKRWQEAAGKESFVQMDVIEGYLTRLEADPQTDAAQLLTQLLELHFAGLLANPKAVQGKKAKPVYSPRQQEIAARLLKLQAS